MNDGSTSSAGGGTLPPPKPPHLEHHASSNMEHMNRYGQHQNLVFHSEVGERLPARRVRELIGKPVIRQWIENGKLYREAESREVPRMELFLDLMYVGIIHYLAEAAVEEPGGLAVCRFILTFYPSWSIWEEARRYSNVSGLDDLLHRCWVLIGMICLLGYTANAAAIELHPHGEEESELDHTAIHAAVAFWLVVKLTRVLVLWYYAWRLPKFRVTQFFNGVGVLLPMFVYLPLLWIKNRPAQIAVATAAICVDLIRIDAAFIFIGGRYMRFQRDREEKRLIAAGELRPEDRTAGHSELRMVDFKGFRIPAVNIEHTIERLGAFVVIVLGELVMNLIYKASPGEFGVSHMFGKAALGLMVGWALNYLYMTPVESPFGYEHAIRRSWATGLIWQFLVLASAASGEMVRNDEVEPAIKWYWGCGLGFAVFFLTVIDVCHRHMHPWKAERIPRLFRTLFELGGALALMLFPLSAEKLSSTEMMGIAVGITWAILIVNIIGQMPTKAHRNDGLVEERESATVVTDLNLDRIESHHTGRRTHRSTIDDEMDILRQI